MKITELKERLDIREILSKTKANYGQQVTRIRLCIEAIGFLLIAGYIFYDSCWIGLLFFPYIFLHVKKGMERFRVRQQERIAVEFKDGMQAVVSSLTAGYSLENSFRESLEELKMIYGTKTLIYKGFSRIVNRLNLNMNIEDAFDEFAKECNVEEIDIFAQILHYAKRSGGNLIDIIRSTTETISEKIDVKREIRTIISAKQFEQNIMNYVPIGIILYMRVTSGEMFEKVYGNVVGVLLMTGCLLVYFFARIIAEKIVDIKV